MLCIYTQISTLWSALLSSELFFGIFQGRCISFKTSYSTFHLEMYLHTTIYVKGIESHFYKQHYKLIRSWIKDMYVHFWLWWISFWMLYVLTASYSCLYASLRGNSFIRCCGNLQIILNKQTRYYFVPKHLYGYWTIIIKQSILSIQKWLTLQRI